MMIEHNGIQCSAEQKANAEAAEALLPQGVILGIAFPVQNLVAMWQSRNYYQQQESQMTWIEFETGGTLERIEINSHPYATTYYKAAVTTKQGMRVELDFASHYWSIEFATGLERSDVVFAIGVHPNNSVKYTNEGLWRMTAEQCSEIAQVLECLTYRPAKEWAKVLTVKAAEQILQMEG